MSLNSAPSVSTSVGNRELLTSGIVHLEGDDPIVISIENLSFKFSFQNDDLGTRYTGTFKGTELEFTLFNHKNSLGEGKLAPVEVANINGRPLSFTYYVNTVNGDSGARRFEYAFYLGVKNA